MNKIFYLLVFLICISACSKDSKQVSDNNPPVIIPVSPANNQVFTAGQSVSIQAHITDDQKIFVVHVHISDKNTGQLLFDIHRYPDNASYELNESLIAKAGTEYKIQIIARDTGGNEVPLNIFISAN